MPRSVGGYELGPVIGVGALGRVMVASVSPAHLAPSAEVSQFAVRMLEHSSVRLEEGEEKLRRDLSTLKMVNHPNIISLVEVLRTRSHLYLVTELAPNANTILRRVAEGGKMDEPDARDMFQRIVCAIRFCHKKKIPHRNIKPSTVLLVPTVAAGFKKPTVGAAAAAFSVKVSGLGLAMIRQPPAHAMLAQDAPPQAAPGLAAKASTLGKASPKADAEKSQLRPDPNVKQRAAFKALFQHPLYAPPEALKDSQHDPFIADVWSLGILLFFMLSGCLPFEEPTIGALQQSLESGEFRMIRYVTDSAKKFIARMLTVEPKRRITVEEIISDPWFSIDFNADLLALGSLDAIPSPIVSVSAQTKLTGQKMEDKGAVVEALPAVKLSMAAGSAASTAHSATGAPPFVHFGGTKPSIVTSSHSLQGKPYTHLSPLPLDGFGIIMRLMSTTFAGLSDTNLNQVGHQAQASASVFSDMWSLRRPAEGPSVLQQRSRRKTIMLARTSVSRPNQSQVEGSVQDILTALQSLHCHPQLHGNGDITGFFIGGKLGQLDLRMRVLPTILTNLSIAVIEAEKGGTSDFLAFFTQLQAALGLAVVSVQTEPEFTELL